MDVYNPERFEERVNYAASVISTGVVPMNGRHFDTCFEMFDGDYVAAALVRRALKNPNTKLAANIFRFINKELATQNYEKTKHLTRKQLRKQAIQAAADRKASVSRR